MNDKIDKMDYKLNEEKQKSIQLECLISQMSQINNKIDKMDENICKLKSDKETSEKIMREKQEETAELNEKLKEKMQSMSHYRRLIQV